MKQTVTSAMLAFLLFFCLLPSAAQNVKEYTYSRTVGKHEDKVKVIFTDKENGCHELKFLIGSQTSWQELDKDYFTTSWHIRDEAKHIHIDITLADGLFHVKGYDGKKSFDRTVESDGTPWVQNAGFLSIFHVTPGSHFKSVNIRPGEYKPYPMESYIAGPVTWGGKYKCTNVKVTPTGIFAKFWHADYYVDFEAGRLVGYQSVEGGPGTPKTSWVLD